MYVPSTRKIISSYDVFYEFFSSALAYTSQPYSEAMYMHPAVPYTPYATYPMEQTGDMIMLAQLKKGVYYLKLITMRKEVTNPMTIQLFGH